MCGWWRRRRRIVLWSSPAQFLPRPAKLPLLQSPKVFRCIVVALVATMGLFGPFGGANFSSLGCERCFRIFWCLEMGLWATNCGSKHRYIVCRGLVFIAWNFASGSKSLLACVCLFGRFGVHIEMVKLKGSGNVC